MSQHMFMFLFDVINQFIGWFMLVFRCVTHLMTGVFSPLKPSNPQWDAFSDEGNESGAQAEKIRCRLPSN